MMTMDNQTRSALRQFARNERWGTCVACPRTVEGEVFPEFCEYTNRYDHQLEAAALFHLVNVRGA